MMANILKKGKNVVLYKDRCLLFAVQKRVQVAQMWLANGPGDLFPPQKQLCGKIM